MTSRGDQAALAATGAASRGAPRCSPESAVVAVIISVSMLLALAWLRLLHAAGVTPPAWLCVCPLRAATGIPCPACGGMHALLALSGGNIGAAIAWNPLVAGAAMAAVASPLMVLAAGRDRVVSALRRLAHPAVLRSLLLIQWAYIVIHLAH